MGIKTSAIPDHSQVLERRNKPSKIPVMALDKESSPKDPLAKSSRGIHQLPSNNLNSQSFENTGHQSSYSSQSNLARRRRSYCKRQLAPCHQMSRGDLTEVQLLERVKKGQAVSASGNLILCRACIVILRSLQEHMFHLSSEGHQGLVKTNSDLH